MLTVDRISKNALIFGAFLVVLWCMLFWQLSGEWSINDQYGYGWFVPLFAAVLFWLRWEDCPAAGQGGQRSDVSGRTSSFIIHNSYFAAALLLLLLPLRLFEIANPDWRPLSWIHTLVVTALSLWLLWRAGGEPWLKHFAFPVLFIFVAVPWVTPVEEPVVQGLMRLVAAIASEAVTLFGIPAQLEGNLIRVSNGLVGVNEACSGVRSLQTSLMIGLLFGELRRLSVPGRFALVGAAIAIAFIGNCVRAFLLVWIAATKNVMAVDRWHDAAGYGILAAVFIGSLFFANRFAKSKVGIKKEESRNQNLAAETAATTPLSIARTSSFLIFNSYITAAALVWLIAVEISAASWYRAHERNLVMSARWEISWPQSAGNFREIKIDETVQRILRFDQGRAASWTWPGFATLDLASSFTARPPVCSLFFFRWKPGKNSALLANLHRPDVCLPAVGWQQVADSGVKNYSAAAGLDLPFRHFEFRHGSAGNPQQQVAHAFYCLWEDRAPKASKSQLAQMAGASSAWTRSERVQAVLEGRRHRGQQVMELVIQTRGPIEPEQAEARFAQVLPSLVKMTDGQ